MSWSPRPCAPRWKELAGAAGHLLDGLVDEEWGRRYGRPVRLGKNPTRSKTRINATGNDAYRLLGAGSGRTYRKLLMRVSVVPLLCSGVFSPGEFECPFDFAR